MIGTPAHRLFCILVLVLSAAIGLGAVSGCNNDAPAIVGVTSNGSASLDAIPLPRDGKHDAATTLGIVNEVDYTAMRLRIGHMWFQADGETEFEAPVCVSDCALTDVRPGDLAKVQHHRDPAGDGSYYAREIEVEAEEDEEEPEDPEEDTAGTEGTVEAVNGGRLMVSGTWFWTDAATDVELDECAGSSFSVGDRVKIEHSTVWSDGLGFHAFKVEVRCTDG